MQDNANQQAQLVAILNGSDVPLELSQPAVVKLKSHFSIDANLTLAPQNINVSSTYVWGPNGYQYCAFLNLINYEPYKIEKDSTGSSFSIIDSIYSSYYYDYKVTSGKTYRYRAYLYPYTYWYSSDYAYAVRPNNYTNIVSITIP